MKEEVLPDEAVITPARSSDKTRMNDLVVEEEIAINVFDRAYVDYKKFDRYCENGTLFITRFKSNAIKEVAEELPVNPDSLIKKHQIVYLGNLVTYKMKNKLRLIETEDTEGNSVVIITNDFKLEPEKIGDISRNCWQI